MQLAAQAAPCSSQGQAARASDRVPPPFRGAPVPRACNLMIVLSRESATSSNPESWSRCGTVNLPRGVGSNAGICHFGDFFSVKQ